MKQQKQYSAINPRYSLCTTANLKDLDWDAGWWTDNSFEKHYLHVCHKDGETVHRVFCKKSETPRIKVELGDVFWLVP